MLEREEVLKLAKLSRLSIAEEDIPAIKGHLDKMLDHLEALKALDLSNVEPMTAVENGATILKRSGRRKRPLRHPEGDVVRLEQGQLHRTGPHGLVQIPGKTSPEAQRQGDDCPYHGTCAPCGLL